MSIARNCAPDAMPGVESVAAGAVEAGFDVELDRRPARCSL
jgi:hypothetical protein